MGTSSLIFDISNQMYDNTMNNTITMGYVIEHLTRPELTRLKKMVLGYGNFKKVASTIPDMHPNTFRNILDKGYGIPENIEKIRMSLLQSKAA